MLTTLKSLDTLVLSPFARLADALCDPVRRNRVALKAAVLYAVIWTLYAIVAKSSQGINADLGEMVVWSRNLDWGYPKHGPFPAWILAGWFAVFPLADWAYYVLAGLNLGIGLYLSFFLCGLWLDGEKRAVAPFLLALIPFYNFLGLKWDQNSILIPLWALTTWAFVISLERRHIGYAALAGAAAAAAVLTKYWSGFLIVALIIAALLDERRAAYFRSGAPWTTALVGAVLIAPNLVWLVQNDFPPMHWVSTRRVAEHVSDWVGSLQEYAFGTIGYAAVAMATYGVLVRPSLAALRDSLFPRDNARRLAAVIFWLPLLLPIACALVMRVRLLSVWNEESLTLLPVVLLSSPLITASRTVAARIIGFAIIASVGALLASPFVAGAKLIGGVENFATYVPAASAAIEREWRATTNRRLEIVAGPVTLTESVSFTLSDQPSTYSNFSAYLSPWVDEQALLHKGLAIICLANDPLCLQKIDELAKRRPVARRVEVELTPRWLWLSGEPLRFLIAMLPPR